MTKRKSSNKWEGLDFRNLRQQKREGEWKSYTYKHISFFAASLSYVALTFITLQNLAVHEPLQVRGSGGVVEDRTGTLRVL